MCPVPPARPERLVEVDPGRKIPTDLQLFGFCQPASLHRWARGFVEKRPMITLTELFTRNHETRSTTATRFTVSETRLAEGGVTALSAAKPGTPEGFGGPL